MVNIYMVMVNIIEVNIKIIYQMVKVLNIIKMERYYMINVMKKIKIVNLFFEKEKKNLIIPEILNIIQILQKIF